jgi:hypothetical protein
MLARVMSTSFLPILRSMTKGVQELRFLMSAIEQLIRTLTSIIIALGIARGVALLGAFAALVGFVWLVGWLLIRR